VTRRQALELLRQWRELRLVRGHWCSRCRTERREYREVFPVATGDELVRAGLALQGGDRLRPA
jgi:hypothetical protein